MTEDQKRARRGWHGNLNQIPLSIAYDFELRLIIENDRSEGFRSSPSRITAAKSEFSARGIA